MESLHNAIIKEDGTILDKYDQEILDIVRSKHVEKAVEDHWGAPYAYNELFAYCCNKKVLGEAEGVGCLTQVRSFAKLIINSNLTINKQLTEELRSDPRIHNSHYGISKALLKCET